MTALLPATPAAPSVGVPAAGWPAEPDRRPQLRHWLGEHRYGVITVVVLLAVVGAVHGIGMSHSPSFADDEGTYAAQAWAVQHGRLAPYTYWYDHPPLGWIQMALQPLLASAATPAVIAVRQVVFVYDLAAAGLLFLLARRLGMGRVAAAAAVLLFSLSPLALHYQRMAYLDNIATPWLLLAFCLALTPRRRLGAYIGSGAAFAAAVLSKETFLLAMPGLILAVWAGAHRRTRAFCLTGFAVTFVMLVLGYPLMAVLRGELIPGRGHVSLLSAIAFQLVSRPGTGTVLSASSASRGLLDSWLQLDPWLLLAGLLATLPALRTRQLRPIGATFAVLVLVGLKPGYLPQPYVIALLPFAALLPVGVAERALRWGWVRSRPAATRREVDSWEPASRARSPLIGRLALVSAGLACVAGIMGVAPAWASGDARLMTTNRTASILAAEHWIAYHIPHKRRLLIDDTMWVDLVHAGFNPNLGVVWYYKLGFANNLDPSVRRALPAGWRDFDYVILTPDMRSTLALQPGHLLEVRQAVEHSRVVASFGNGAALVQVRRIVGGLPPGHRVHATVPANSL